jgi:hypothetical protein
MLIRVRKLCCYLRVQYCTQSYSRLFHSSVGVYVTCVLLLYLNTRSFQIKEGKIFCLFVLFLFARKREYFDVVSHELSFVCESCAVTCTARKVIHACFHSVLGVFLCASILILNLFKSKREIFCFFVLFLFARSDARVQYNFLLVLSNPT